MQIRKRAGAFSATRGLILLAVAISSQMAAAATVVTGWNTAILSAIRPHKPPPVLLARNMAIAHRAAFDAAAVAGHLSSDQLFLKESSSCALIQKASAEAAFSGAMHEVLTMLFPVSAPVFDQHLKYLIAHQNIGGNWESGLLLGRKVAHLHLLERDGDGMAGGITYVPLEQPGQWRRTPPAFRPPELPHAGRVRTFLIGDPASVLPPPPPVFQSAEFLHAALEVGTIGAAVAPTRSPENSVNAEFWSDFCFTVTPPGHWNQITAAIAAQFDLSVLEESHLFAGLNSVLADAGIACWFAKYHYNFWRPVSAIHTLAASGEAGFEGLQQWQSMLPSPPHPEYPSGHSSFSGAAARFLQLYFAADQITFSATSDSVPGVVLQFDSIWQCAESISESRIHGGIHFRFSCDAGLRLGAAIAEFGLQ